MAKQHDAFGVHVLALAQELDDRADVLGRIRHRRAFGAPPALPDAALVVSKHVVTRVSQRRGQQPEYRDAGHRLVAIGRARSCPTHEHNRRVPPPGFRRRLARRLAEGSRQVESVAGNSDRQVAVAADDERARGDRGKVFADEDQRLRGDLEFQQAPGLVGPDDGVERVAGILEGQRVGADVDDSTRRLDLLRRARVLLDGDLGLGGDVDWKRRPVGDARQPHRQRLVRAEEEVGEHQRIGRDRVGLGRRRASLRDLAGRLAIGKRRPDHQGRAARHGVHRQVDRMPVGVVAKHALAGQQVQWRRQPTVARDGDSRRRPAHGDLFTANRRPLEEDSEACRALGRLCQCAAGGRQNDGCRNDTHLRASRHAAASKMKITHATSEYSEPVNL